MSSPNNTAKTQKLLLLDLSKSIKPNKAAGPSKPETIQINPNQNHWFNGKAVAAGPKPPMMTVNGFLHHHRMTTAAPPPRPVALNGPLRNGSSDPFLLKPGPHAYQLTNGHVHKLSPSSSVSSSSCVSCSTNCSSCPNCTSSCGTSSKASSVCSGTSKTGSTTSSSSSSSSMLTRSSKLVSSSSSSSKASSSTLNESNQNSDDSLISFDSTLSLSASNSNSSSTHSSGSSSFSFSSTTGSTLSISSSNNSGASSDSNDDEDSTGRVTRSAICRSITKKRKSDIEENRKRRLSDAAQQQQPPTTPSQREPLQTVKTNFTQSRLAFVEESQGPSFKRHKTERPSNSLLNASQNSIEVICLDDDEDETPVAKSVSPRQRPDVKTTIKTDDAPLRCLWNDCGFTFKPQSSGFDPRDELVEHVKKSHVSSQKKGIKYRCLWNGCRIHGKTISSHSWLENHVANHAKKSLFRCIFKGCKRKFRLGELLEDHYASSHSSSSSRRNETSPVKTRKQQQPKTEQVKVEPAPTDRKNLRKQQTEAACKNNASTTQPDKKSKTKKKRQNGHADAVPRKFIRTQFKDYVDGCTMKVIEKRLVDLDYQSGTVTFTPRISGIETRDGKTCYLVEWQPPNILNKQWLQRHEIVETKTVSLADLGSMAVKDGTSPFYRALRFRPNRHK